MKSNCALADIAAVLRARQRFVVSSHMRPDGDALGCTLAMTLCLRQLGKDVTAWNEDGMPEKFRYLPCSELVTQPPAEPQSFDVAIVLDNAVENRAGTARAAIAHADVWINIDHHHTNERYGDLAYLDATAPAAGQVLYELFRQCDLPLTYEMADNLSSPSAPTPARSNIRTPPRAPTKSPPTSSVPASKSANFRRRCTRATRAAGWSCSARC